MNGTLGAQPDTFERHHDASVLNRTPGEGIPRCSKGLESPEYSDIVINACRTAAGGYTTKTTRFR